MIKKKLKKDNSVEKIIKALKVVGVILEIHPTLVTRAKLIKHSDVSDHALKKTAGLTQIKNTTWPMEKDFKTIVETGKTSSYIKKLEKNVGTQAYTSDQVAKWIKEAVSSVKVDKTSVKKAKKTKGKRNMTIELLLSDWHIGKKTKTFDHTIAQARLQQYMKVFHKELTVYQKSFNVERIIIANVGDLLENYLMHDLESAIGCEFNNPEQMRQSMELLFNEVVKPVAKLGVKVEFIGVTGNHDRQDRKKTMVDPGKNHLSWVVYHAIKMLSEASNYKHINFTIPENTGTVLDIYGSNVLYEHGDWMKSKLATGCESHISKRSQQLGIIIDMLRSGHFHEYTVYGRGRVIINESLCGQDGYSETSGYNSHSGQSINYYIENKDRPNSFYHSFPVYLG